MDSDACRSAVIEPYDSKVAGLVPGGETRKDSVFTAWKVLPDNTDFIVVHDGVRPLGTDEMMVTCLEAAADCGAASPHPVKEYR